MKNSVHYSDEDFQNVLDETFEGDLISFHNHLVECAECKTQYDTYLEMSISLKRDLTSLTVDAHMIDSMWSKVRKKHRSYSLDNLLFWLIISVASACTIVCFVFLLKTGLSYNIIVFIFLLVMVNLWISLKEIDSNRKSTNRMMNLYDFHN